LSRPDTFYLFYLSLCASGLIFPSINRTVPLNFACDADNRLKDIMDALQCRAGGSKKRRILSPIIPNDKQIYRVTVEKALLPKQSKGMGHLVITKHEDI